GFRSRDQNAERRVRGGRLSVCDNAVCRMGDCKRIFLSTRDCCWYYPDWQLPQWTGLQRDVVFSQGEPCAFDNANRSGNDSRSDNDTIFYESSWWRIYRYQLLENVH